MNVRLILAAFVLLAACSPANESSASKEDVARWEAQADRVNITRDDWGIAHVHGPTDADAVFGMIYAQAEDDFNRIEVNYLTSMGRMSEAEGEDRIWQDLRMRLFIDSTDMKAKFAESPAWLQELMTSWADGLNYYLYTHPDVKPRVLTKFEPWMPLTFSEGSIGGDIENISLTQLQAFYTDTSTAYAGGGAHRRVNHIAVREVASSFDNPSGIDQFDRSGSNGFAVAPANTANKRALLLINPHTSFFFRSELHVRSDEGLNAYGAATWGQFFIYQGFNDRAGWMHTSSGADNQDEFAVTVVKTDGGFAYQHGNETRQATSEVITIPYKSATGMSERQFTVYRTHHGPVVRGENGKWIAVRLMQEPVKALTQSYSRTKARSLAEFRQSMDLHTNSSNNTIYADADGHIAYFHANFVPKRDTTFNWRAPVDGNNPATDWTGVHSVDESPLVIDPAVGWVQNTNNEPFNAAGANSPKRSSFPRYMETYSENPRGVNAVRVLSARKDFTIETLRDAAYDSYQPAFATLVPSLLRAYDALPAGDARKGKLAEPVAQLRNWDYRWSETSVPTSLAVYWGDELFRVVRAAPEGEDIAMYDGLPTKISDARKVDAFAAAVDSLNASFGTWKTPWGEINRFQRLTNDIVHPFDDAKPSIPVPFTSNRWGSLASFGTSTVSKTKKRYGTGGNSFVAVVEFGDSVRARAVTAGGESGDPASKHFNDQAERYARGDLREVYFYPNQLAGHTERTYKPGK